METIIEYPIRAIIGCETCMKIVYEKEDGSAETIELSFDETRTRNTVKRNLKFSETRHCVEFEKKEFQSGLLHPTKKYQTELKYVYFKK